MLSLTPDRWQEISPYLDQVLSLPEQERAAWLESFAAEKPELVQLLQNLLEEQQALAQERFLERLPVQSVNQLSLAGQTIGAYTLISPIGQGGMGSVWLAERSDGRFERRVAIKFLHFSLATQGGAERFTREGRILGQLSHPNIAELIDAGVTPNGQPYLVLEHVDGEHIDEYCDQHMLDLDSRIRLFLDVLSAVAQAHANLIVHRDIKPSNVLVRNDGQVKLLDFGIAKLLASDDQATASLLTAEGGGALTPLFAAPEQITAGTMTTATDVYALGVLLYLLLTGQHPAGAGPHSPAELVKAIVDTEPPRLSEAIPPAAADAVAGKRGSAADKLRRQLRGDLDTIVGKALKKKPQERYSSVTTLADDLRRYLKHEPISTRPDTMAYRAGKFVRRNWTAVALTGLALAATIAGLVGTLMQTHRARVQRDFAFRQISRAEAINDLNLFLLSDAAPSGKPFTGRELLQRAEHIVEQQHATDDPDRVRLMVSIGTQYLQLDETESALRILKEAYKLSRSISDASVRADASCALANTLSRSQDFERAEKLFQEGLRELPQEPQFALERVSCLSSGSDIAEEVGNVKEGIARAEAARLALQQSPFDSDALELRRWSSLADAYSSAGENSKAVSAFERSLQLTTALGRGDTSSASVLLNNLALQLDQMGRPLEAEKMYRRSIEITTSNATQDSVSPILLNNYARTLRELGRLEKAANTAERACEKARRVGPQVAVNHLLLERARIYTLQHKPDQASAMLAEVEPKLRKDLPPGHFAFATLAADHARIALERGDVSGATEFAEQAVAINEAAIKAGKEGSYVLPKVLVCRAEVRLAAGRSDQAATDAARAVSLLQSESEQGTYSSVLGSAFLALGRALQAQGKASEARTAFRSAAEHLEHTVGSDHPDTRSASQLAGLAIPKQ